MTRPLPALTLVWYLALVGLLRNQLKRPRKRALR
jgi:hypothetical protein